MSIQFLCVSCRKPIEVDDQWAMKIVQCPYCQDQVTAPGMSTYQPEAPAMAREVAVGAYPPGSPDSSDSPYPPPQAGYAQPALKSNGVAIAALVLAILSLGMFVGFTASMIGRIEPILEKGGTVQEQEEALRKFFLDAAERQESWMMTAGLLALGAMMCWGAAVICGLIGISRPVRRGFAIAGLVIAAIPAALFLFRLLV